MPIGRLIFKINPAALTMGDKDIKAGETYNVRVKVTHVDAYKNVRVNTVDENDKQLGVESTVFYSGELRAFSPITPENGKKNTESAPKYDPRRKFRKGDKVRLREYNGRKPYDFWHKQTIKHFGAKLDTVLDDEKEDSGHVDIFQDAPIDELTVRVHASYLELVTPVEELEPYSIDPANTNVLFKRGKKIATFEDDDEAQDLCDRLNAEHRKEQQ